MELINQPELMAGVTERHQWIVAALDEINQRLHLFKEVRGLGLLPRQRIAAIGGAVGANAHHQRQIFARQHRTNREAAAQRFGAGEHIRRR